MLKKICILFTKYFKKCCKYKGDYRDGLYNFRDSSDETELVNILSGDNIIHPYPDEVCVLYNNNKYCRLATYSPDITAKTDDTTNPANIDNTDNTDNTANIANTDNIDNTANQSNMLDITDILDTDNSSDIFCDAQESNEI